MPPTKKTAAKKTASRKPRTAVVPEIAEEIEDRTGRFWELQSEVVSAPYRLTPDIILPPLTRRRLKEFMAADNEEEKARLLFDIHADEIEALYEDRPIQEWAAMLREVYGHFFGRGALDLPGGSDGS